MTTIFLLIFSMILLYAGASAFVRGGTSISRLFHIPQYAIGATVVALGTSLPELVTSSYASYKGKPQISVSNVIGSNIVNIGLVLGSTALLFTLVSKRDIFKRDIPPFLSSLVLLFVVMFDGRISRLDGIFLLISFIAYTVWLLHEKDTGLIEDVSTLPNYSLPVALLFLTGGIIFLYFGGKYLVTSSVTIAKSLHISQWVIGATVAAFGTSAPEFFVSIVAMLHGSNELAIGNVIGSNITNILLVLGTASVISGLKVSSVSIYFDFSFLFLLSLLIAFMVSDRKIGKESGLMLLILLTTYIITIVHLHKPVF